MKIKTRKKNITPVDEDELIQKRKKNNGKQLTISNDR